MRSDPEYWRNRADEARAVAGQFEDEGAKRIMLEIAESYDRLARHAAGRQRRKSTLLRKPEPHGPL
jgi:hypothetical protein